MSEKPHSPITLDVLQHWPAYRTARAALYGGSWLRRLYMRWLHPWLRPRRQAQLEADFHAARSVLMHDYLNAFRRAGAVRHRSLHPHPIPRGNGDDGRPPNA